MDFYVYDENLNAVGIIDNYTSVIWTLRYNDVGDFEIYIRSTPEILEMCKINRYIRRNTDNTVMIIKSITQSDSVENGNYITISGKSVENILSQRVVWNVSIVSGRIEECVYSLLNENAITPIDTKRVLPNLTKSSLKHLTAEISETNFTGTNLLTAIKTLCETAGFGFKITFSDAGFVFEIYNGVDRSRNQTENPYVIFDAENIAETTYTDDAENYKNVALIGGSGEFITKLYASYGNATGLNRFETFVNQSSISEVSLLKSAGRDALHDAKNNRTFDGEIANYYTYGVNYNLGDIVQIESAGGIAATPRIIEIIQSIDDSGIFTIPTFSEWEVV